MTHMRGEEREAFEQAVESGDLDQLRVAAGRLWNCTDVMPSSLCDDLDMPYGSNYSQAARRIRAKGAS